MRPPALQLHATSPQPDPEAQRAAGKALTVPRSLPQAPAIDVLLPTLAICLAFATCAARAENVLQVQMQAQPLVYTTQPSPRDVEFGLSV